MLDDSVRECESGSASSGAPASSAAVRAPKVDNFPSRTRRPKLFRDILFVQTLCHYLHDSGLSATLPISVYYHTRTLHSPPLPPAQRRTRFYAWHEVIILPPEIRRRHRVPAIWRDTTDQLKTLYLHMALAHLGPVHSFSCNMNGKIEALCRSKNAPVSWLHDRVRTELQEALGRSVELFFVLEETDDRNRRLHIHGEFQIVPEEARAARRALRRACGEWAKVRQHQAYTEANPDECWAPYATKHAWKAIPRARAWLDTMNAPIRLRFDGGVLAKTHGITRLARELYEDDRAFVIGATNGIKALG